MNIIIDDEKGVRTIDVSADLYGMILMQTATPSTEKICGNHRNGLFCERPHIHTGAYHAALNKEGKLVVWPNDAPKPSQHPEHSQYPARPKGYHLPLHQYISVKIGKAFYHIAFRQIMIAIGRDSRQMVTVCVIKQSSPVMVFSGASLQKVGENSNIQEGRRIAFRRAMQNMAAETIRLVEQESVPEARMHLVTNFTNEFYSAFRQRLWEISPREDKIT